MHECPFYMLSRRDPLLPTLETSGQLLSDSRLVQSLNEVWKERGKMLKNPKRAMNFIK